METPTIPAVTRELLQFLDRSPTPFHAVENIAAQLDAAGYARISEGADWEAQPGKYYFLRNDSSLLALEFNRAPAQHGFRVIGAHTDSPCLKVKPNAISIQSGYARLAVEVYGGALLAPWFDRGLGLAGRVTFGGADGSIQNRLVNFARPIAFIPSLAIHLNPKVNHKRSINAQLELPALLCRSEGSAAGLDFDALLRAQIKAQHRVTPAKILAHDLYLYDCQGAELVGLNHEFIASARLDNLLSCYAGGSALLACGGDANKVLVLNDHEEVGSVSAHGADSPFLASVLQRACGGEHSQLSRALSRSMLLSVDNAHAVHPNYPDKHEPGHQPLINAGTVIKTNSNQRYATNSETAALFKQICDARKLPFQELVVRADMGCGSTIGPITAAKLGIRTADVGVAQLGMHSIRELVGSQDPAILTQALQGFLELESLPF